MDFEWDSQKARENERKHGVAFAEATEVFGDDLSLCVPDPDHSDTEERFLLFGRTSGGQNLVVSFTERGDTIRPIPARAMTTSERQAHEPG